MARERFLLLSCTPCMLVLLYLHVITLYSPESYNSPRFCITNTSKKKNGQSSLDEHIEFFRNEILKNETVPLLTLFTTWNEDSNEDKHKVHKRTVDNWTSLRPFVIPLVFTNDKPVATECLKAGWQVLPVYKMAANGIPVLKSMYEVAMNKFNTTFYAYSNSDLLYTETLVKTLVSLVISRKFNRTEPVLIVGKRINLNVTGDLSNADWKTVTDASIDRGKLFTGYAIDYFITTRAYPWSDAMDFVIGRVAYDNWVLYSARREGHYLIDATNTLNAVHQTTGAGNYEGWKHDNGNYNKDLIMKNSFSKDPLELIYDYDKGQIDCIDKYTIIESNCLVLKSRHITRKCKVITKFIQQVMIVTYSAL